MDGNVGRYFIFIGYDFDWLADLQCFAGGKKIHDVLGNAIGETTKKMLIKTEESKEEAIGTSLFNLGQAMFYNGFYIHALDNFIKALGAIRKSSMDNKEMHIEKCLGI